MLRSKPLKIGITGGIGSGKSIVCEIFRVLNIPVYDADMRARTLMTEDEVTVAAIKNIFGPEAYTKDRALNRTYLAKEVFNDREKLNKLNSIVHPAVEKDFEKWYDSHETSPYVIKEAALLVESGSYKQLDMLITVTAPEEIRVARVMRRDPHRTEEDIRKIIASQLDENTKIARSQFVVINDDKTLVIPQVLKIHRRLLNKVDRIG